MTQAVAAFGFSRPSFYQALAAFKQGGLGGLIPQKRGPKAAHKLTVEVLAIRARATGGGPYAASWAGASPTLRCRVHPRSIERALAHSKKNARQRDALRESRSHAHCAIRTTAVRCPEPGRGIDPGIWAGLVSATRNERLDARVHGVCDR